MAEPGTPTRAECGDPGEMAGSARLCQVSPGLWGALEDRRGSVTGIRTSGREGEQCGEG